jgi:hypothetical protein
VHTTAAQPTAYAAQPTPYCTHSLSVLMIANQCFLSYFATHTVRHEKSCKCPQTIIQDHKYPHICWPKKIYLQEFDTSNEIFLLIRAILLMHSRFILRITENRSDTYQQFNTHTSYNGEQVCFALVFSLGRPWLKFGLVWFGLV